MDIKDTISNWLQELSATETIPKSIKGLYFGLKGTLEGYAIYLTGAKRYDENDDDWACEIDYEPKNKYLILPVQDSICQWTLLKKTRETLKELLANHKLKSQLFNKFDHIALGFDDGELVTVK
ncbi:hypothetical protein [Sphingobacterium lactis]|uniref:hypothetical protein n=1 Tax=Sphingobacterium lactis TaxID=797291 RepID=UPI003DA2D758